MDPFGERVGHDRSCRELSSSIESHVVEQLGGTLDDATSKDNSVGCSWSAPHRRPEHMSNPPLDGDGLNTPLLNLSDSCVSRLANALTRGGVTDDRSGQPKSGLTHLPVVPVIGF
mmetsp:Transcript_18215/g.48938  ORF Transcript_18215/g.48938 Transcript_18215/m.48938 type:complete len:115 (+) Transcript_18215:1261-1605(+)